MIVLTDRPIAFAALTKALHIAVPSVASLTELRRVGVKVLRDDAEEFSSSERAAIEAIVSAHDAVAIRQEEALRAQRQREERAKDPTTLSLPDRVTRIEWILNLEQGG